MLLDKDIREPLFEFLEERYGKVRILEEKTVGNSRADVVMVIPEKIVGIEIKSDADTYTRLERQVADYDLYFDANIVVVGSSHASHVAEHVPAALGDRVGRTARRSCGFLYRAGDAATIRMHSFFGRSVCCGARSLPVFRRNTDCRCTSRKARILSVQSL